MSGCARCEQLYRVRRTMWQRFVYRAVYECAECESRVLEPRRFTFRFSRRVRCPECGTYHLRKFSVRDRIERMSSHPWNLVQRLLGGRLYFCPLCRLQFHDWRHLSPGESTAVYGRTAHP